MDLETFESSKDICNMDNDNNPPKLETLNFYSPLGASGYLTPLQRKKLREKRKISLDLNDSNSGDVKKSRTTDTKRKKGAKVMRHKTKKQTKRLKMDDKHGRVQFTVSQIVSKHHEINEDAKTKKFFKSSSIDRLQKANFTMPLVLKKNIFSNINKCVKETISKSKKLYHKNNISDYCLSSDAAESYEDINNTTLPSEQENDESNPADFPKSDENKQCVFEFDWPCDEELLERQEKARLKFRESVLEQVSTNLQEHKKSQNVKLNNEDNQVKLYPVFLIAKKKKIKVSEDTKRRSISKKLRDPCKGASNQMFIDAGQKEIGPKICSTCNMLYTVGQEEDIRLHLNYHDMYLVNLKFHGWKDENVIGEYSDGRVIMIRKSDKSFKVKKVEDVLEVANRDLGFPSSAIPTTPDLTFLLFISIDKQVAGCLVAEPISKAYQVLLGSSADALQDKVWRIGDWYSSSKAVPAVCGINRIWVAHSYRRLKVASRMLDCLRCHFLHGHVVGIREIGFTDPSPDGREFAAAYTGTDHFLVYK